MDGIHLAFRAIDSTLRGELAFCKFLSSNDTGESGGHQSGIYIPRDSAAILFDEPGVKGENKHREVKISWADGTVTDDALFNFYGAGSRNEYRITRIDRAIRSFSDDLTGALFVLVRIDNSNFNGFILDNESQINEYLSNFYCSPIQAGKLVFLHEPFEFLTLKEDPTTIPVMSLPEGFSNTEKQPDTEGDADAVLYSLLKGMGDIHIADHSWDIPDGTDVPNLHFSVTHRLINHRRHVYNSILNDSLENILKKRQIAFTKITEGNHTEYQLASTLNPSRGHNRILTMPTCRHGWSEVIKGGRAAQTFIVTFQQGMSEENFSELQDADIILVVPVNLFNMYSPKIRKNLFSLQNLIELASNDMDIKSQKERSLNMSRIRSRDTQAEIYFRKLLYHKGIRYRKNLSTLPGKPDLFIHRFQTVVFVHGCFWHRHQGCKYAYTPSSRQEFWMKKFEDNVRRDRQTVEILKGQGYRIITVWECTLKRMKKDPLFEEEIINQVTDFLKNSSEQWIEY